MNDDLVRASGGVVFRSDGDAFEVLLVHRPRYDDWSLPKGKDDPGESPQGAAIREVEEETGHRCRIVAPLGQQTYTLPSGQTKTVRYFAMQPSAPGRFQPNAEVDEIRWVPVADAAEQLTYRRDRDLLSTADFPRLATTGTVFLVRHALAGARADWEEDDSLRPLTEAGHRQADALADGLLDRSIRRILSSPTVRCRQTVEPLAQRLGLEVENHPALAEAADWHRTLKLMESLAGLNVVMSSHGDLIPDLIRGLGTRGVDLRSPTGSLECKKGSVWEISLDGGAVTEAVYVPPPAV